MKCKNCKIQIPPGFVASIKQNQCPACGQKILSLLVYDKIGKVEQQISDLGFPESQLFGIAAALATRFTLVPLDLAGTVETEEIDHVPSPVASKPSKSKRGKNEPRSIEEMKKLYEKNDPYRDPDDDDDEEEITIADENEDLSEDERRQWIHEFGLDKAASSNIALKDKAVAALPELIEAISPIESFEEIHQPLGTSLPVDAQKAALLMKARAAKENNSHMIPRRVS